jgi:hypothetical protein
MISCQSPIILLSVLLSVCLSACLSACLSCCLSCCLSACLSVHLSCCLSCCLSRCLPACLSHLTGVHLTSQACISQACISFYRRASYRRVSHRRASHRRASHRRTGGRRTYEVTLLWLPPRPEDSISGLISGPPSEPASSRRGSLDTLESFDIRALISRAPTPKQTSHKRQISEAIPRNERLNGPETAPAAALEQGPEHTQEDTQEEGAAGTGPRKSGRAKKPKQRN